MKKKICNRLQETLVTDGPEALRRDETAQRHFEECADCFALLESAQELDAHLESLEPIDAPDTAVEALLSRPEIAAGLTDADSLATSVQAPTLGHFRRWWRPKPLAWGGAAAAVLLLVVGLTQRGLEEDVLATRRVASLEQAGRMDDKQGYAGPALSAEEPRIEPTPDTEASVEEVTESFAFVPDGPPEGSENEGDLAGEDNRNRREGLDSAEAGNMEHVTVVAEVPVVQLESTSTKSSDEIVQDLPVPGRFYQNVLTPAPGIQDSDGEGDADVHGSRDRDFKAVGGVGGYIDPRGGFANIHRQNVPAARLFLDERGSVDGLTYRPARGYWANSYVPGDPALRLLQSRLLAAGSLWRDPATEQRLLLHDGSRRTTQPFDPPRESAIAVYLHADRTALEGPGRMLLQVGLQGTPRHAGRRPPMNVGIVLDLRGEMPAETAVAIRALIDALHQSRQPGDRFRVLAAGRPGGRAVGPDQFRHGYLTVTLNRLLGIDDPLEGPTFDVEQALANAIQDVAGVDDPDAPLGSSSVLLITGSSFGASTPALARMAHQSAVAGVPVSVVAVGGGVELSEIDRLALSGQGNRRLLTAPAEASELIERELSAVSRAVARAVRLRIRLAPGVQLVDVIGSASLDEAGAERVREAEESVDLRLARTLGIEADRGEDEDGVQIVIPTFYAGDSHVILLDIVAPGPGPIADVVARYKDLAQMENGVSRAGLAIGNEQRAAGPLERNVLKNYLAYRLSRTLEYAGSVLAGGDPASAAGLLASFHELLEGLRVELPDLQPDTELAADIAMLAEYGDLLKSDAVDRPERVAYLTDSLRYAARLKLLAPPSVN